MTRISSQWGAVGVLGAALAAVPFIRPEMKSPPHGPLLQGAQAPENVIHLVERACRDCHSDDVHWPWYARIAPMSFLIAHDVDRGRAFLNLSEWASYSRPKKLGYLAGMVSATNARIMPPRAYRLMHSSARLSASDRAMLAAWAGAESRRLRR